MPAISADKRTRDMMRVGAPGEWKHKPLPIPQKDVRPPRVVDPRFKADPSKKPASTGPKPKPRVLDRQEAVRNLVRAGADKASAGDVFGHNERERKQLPNSSLTPNKYGPKPKQRKKTGLGLTMAGPAFAKVRKTSKKSEPKRLDGYVYEIPDRLKKYASA